MAPRRSLKLSLVFALLALAVVLPITHTAWLTALGNRLVREDGPAKADLAVVLAGDKYGNRILKGAELVSRGYVPAVLVSGPGLYNTYECDMAIEFAVREGRGLAPLLAPGGRTVGKADLPKLASPEVFDYVLKRHVRKQADG